MILEYTTGGAGLRNTGAAEQNLEGVTIRHALATIDQEFATATDAKTLAKWRDDVADKKIFPLYEIEELAMADTEDQFFEGNKRYKTKNGKKIRTFNCMIGVLSHRDLASFNGQKMRIYEFTDKQEIKGTTPDDMKVRGQLVTIEVGKRVDAMADKPAYTPVTVSYEDYKEFEEQAVILRPTWSHIELNGIFDVVITQVSAAAGSLKVTVKTLSGDLVKSLEASDFKFVDASGADKTFTLVAPDPNGVYELTGSGFANGYKLSLNGVVSKTEADYESVAALTVSGIS